MYNFDHIELLRRKSPKTDFASDMFSADTENVPVTNPLSSPSSEHVSSLGIANITIVSLEPKMMRRISIGNSMICSDIWHKYHE